MDPKQLNALVHDREAAAYDTRFLIDQGPRLGQELLRELRGSLGKTPKAKRVLDIACGTGFAALGAAHAGISTDVHGCDLSPKMLAETDRHAQDWDLLVSLAACDAEALCYADDSFDLILIRGALHHVPEPLSMLLECRRVLAPGGTAVCLAEPTPTGERQVAAVVGSIWRAGEILKKLRRRAPTAEEQERQQWELASMAANLHTFTREDLEQLATKAGFEDITVGTAWWSWVLTLGVNYFLAGEFESLWERKPLRRIARAALDLAAVADRRFAEFVVPDKMHATVWALLR